MPAEIGDGRCQNRMCLDPEFEPPSREAWLALVAKVLKGGDFEKRLVSRTADGLAIQPLYTRGDAGDGRARSRRARGRPGGWDIRQRHAEPDARRANAAILEDLTGGVSSLLLQIQAPGQSGLPYGAEGLAQALKGVFLNACTIALDARENTMDAAGSLIEIWRAAGIGENSGTAPSTTIRSACWPGPARSIIRPTGRARSPPSSPSTAAR